MPISLIAVAVEEVSILFEMRKKISLSFHIKTSCSKNEYTCLNAPTLKQFC